MKLSHKELIDLLQRAYSAEKAAAFAYQGHAGSVKDKTQKAAIKQSIFEHPEFTSYSNTVFEVFESWKQKNIPY